MKVGQKVKTRRSPFGGQSYITTISKIYTNETGLTIYVMANGQHLSANEFRPYPY